MFVEWLPFFLWSAHDTSEGEAPSGVGPQNLSTRYGHTRTNGEAGVSRSINQSVSQSALSWRYGCEGRWTRMDQALAEWVDGIDAVRWIEESNRAVGSGEQTVGGSIGWSLLSFLFCFASS